MQKGNTSVLWGFILAVIGSACYGLNPLFALPLYDMGVTPWVVLLYRYGIAALLMQVWMLLGKESFRLTKKECCLSMGMSILFAGSSACLFFSFKFMDAGLASVILFTYPLFVVLLSRLVFHEKMSKITLLCIVIAFIGICMLNQITGSGNMSIVGMLLAIASGFTYAIYLIGVNRSVLKTMSPVRLAFYALVSGTLLFAIILLALPIFQDETATLLMPNAQAWIDAIGLALFPTIISMVLVTKSIHIIGSTPASIIGAIEPITALLVSLLCFGGTLTTLNIIGIILVLGAVMLMVYSERK